MVYISEYTLLWLLPIIFMIHRFEELIMMQEYVKDNFDDIVFKSPEKLIKRLRAISVMPANHYCATAFVEFATISLITFYTAETRRYNLFGAVSVFLFLHTFIHLTASIHLKKLTPGIITGLAIVIPYGFKIFMFLTTKETVNIGTILLNIIFILIVYPPFRNMMQMWGSKKR